MKNVLELLENSYCFFPDKTAIAQEEKTTTYKSMYNNSRNIGSFFATLGCYMKPVAVFCDKSSAALECMLGVVYSGNFYTVIDVNMPAERIEKIFSTLSPVALIADDNNIEKAEAFKEKTRVISYNEAVTSKANDVLLTSIRKKSIDTDPVYVLFTSGSTGMPKGTVINHKGVLSYAQWVCETFDITEKTIFGSQTPFYFSMSVLDIFSTLKSGATLNIIPKKYFSFPVKLIEYMNENRINTIYWVPSAYSIVAKFKTFDYIKPEYLKKALFAGEVMPTKQLNVWMKNLPDLLYANLYGPTEVTDICTYYVVNRTFRDDEPLPIGNACNNCDVLIVNDKGEPAQPGEEGELLVRGSFLAMGYYNCPDKTAAAFIQNPVNKAYPETVYKTGDLVKTNDLGEIMYIGRKDYQINHMGYRIELGEVETAISALDGISECICIYNSEKDEVILIYQGKIKTEEIYVKAKQKLPRYMLPTKMFKIAQIPYNANGKIDRALLKKEYMNKE